jgi:hypothetical protein
MYKYSLYSRNNQRDNIPYNSLRLFGYLWCSLTFFPLVNLKRLFLHCLNRVGIFLSACFILFIVNPCADGDSSSNSRDPLLSGGQLSGAGDSNHDDDDLEPPAVVVYLVDPFTIGSDSTDLQRLSCLSLLRCFTSVLATVPESIRNNISVQVCCVLCLVKLRCSGEKASSVMRFVVT